MSDTFWANKTISVSLITIVFAVALVAAILFFLVSVIISLIKKQKVLTKIRYGFGGKPLFSLLIVLALVFAIPLTLYASWHSIEIRNQAKAKKDAIISIDSKQKDAENYSVSFMAIPTIDDVMWAGKIYTMKWRIEGATTFEKVETGRSQEEPSYFIKELQRGTYIVKIIIESENFGVEKDQTLKLE